MVATCDLTASPKIQSLLGLPDNQGRQVVLHDASDTASLALTIATCSTGLQRLVRYIPPFHLASAL